MNQRGFVIPPMLLSPTGIMAAVIVALSLSNVLFYKLWQGEVHDYANYKAEVVSAQAQIDADVQRRLRDSEATTLKIQADLDVALRNLRSRPPIRVLSTNCYTGPGITISKPTPGTDGTAVITPSDTPKLLTAEECEIELIKGITDSTKYNWLQIWLNEQIEKSK